MPSSCAFARNASFAASTGARPRSHGTSPIASRPRTASAPAAAAARERRATGARAPPSAPPEKETGLPPAGGGFQAPHGMAPRHEAGDTSGHPARASPLGGERDRQGGHDHEVDTEELLPHGQPDQEARQEEALTAHQQ